MRKKFKQTDHKSSCNGRRRPVKNTEGLLHFDGDDRRAEGVGCYRGGHYPSLADYSGILSVVTRIAQNPLHTFPRNFL